jgi:hypothetical protein
MNINPNRSVIADVYAALKSILNVLSRPIWTDPSTGRINVAGVTTVTTVTTVADLTRLSTLGAASTVAQSALYVQLYGQERLNWANCVRARIT